MTVNSAKVEGTDSVAELPADPRWVNLIGERNGKLKIVGMARRVRGAGKSRVTWWNVECECGDALVLEARSFRRHTGCKRCQHVEEFINGFKSGPDQQFELVGFSHFRPGSKPGSNGKYIWDCRCKCGEPFKVSSNHLAKTRSCPRCSLRRVSENAIGRRLVEKKNVPTPELRALLERAYDTVELKERTSLGLTSKQIAARTGWKRSALKDLAAAMGLVRPASRPARPWAVGEEEIVSRMRRATIGSMRSVLRAHGYTRSRAELSDRIRQLSLIEHDPCFTASEIVRLLGFEAENHLGDLVRAGKLRPEAGARKRDALEQRFNRTEIKRFLLTHPEAYELQRVDRVFFQLLVIRRTLEIQEAKAA